VLEEMADQCDGGTVPKCPVIDALFDHAGDTQLRARVSNRTRLDAPSDKCVSTSTPQKPPPFIREVSRARPGQERLHLITAGSGSERARKPLRSAGADLASTAPRHLYAA
jgi:hypothetical protein